MREQPAPGRYLQLGSRGNLLLQEELPQELVGVGHALDELPPPLRSLGPQLGRDLLAPQRLPAHTGTQ